MGYYLLYILIIPVLALASPAEEPQETRIPILETTQSLFGGQVNTVANRLDLFFADQRADDELARSRIRIRRSYVVRERAKMDDDTQIRFNIRLPNLEEKFKFNLEKTEGEDTKKKKIKNEALLDAAINQLNEKWQYRADIGVNASIPPRVFLRNRLRKNKQTGDLIHRFVEEISWFSDRDWENNTTLDSDITLDEETLFRFNNTLEWAITRKNFSTSHGPSIRHRLSENEAVSYGVGMSSVIDDVWYVNNYRVSATYRRNLYRQWIYMDLTPGIDFPKTWSFRRTPFFAVAVEALFGGY